MIFAVTGLLPASESHRLQEMSDVQARRGGIEADIGSAFARTDMFEQLAFVRDLSHQAALFHRFNEAHI